MNRNFLDLYNNELHHLRESAGEFAQMFDKTGQRLSLDKNGRKISEDPYVERLLEGFAYLAARVQLKLDAEFPRFTQSLLETVYPHYLCPTPSMAVVRLVPDLQASGPPEGFLVPRDSVLRGTSSDSDTLCEFRTKHNVRIWPIEITDAEYLTWNLPTLGLPDSLDGKAAIRISLTTGGGVKWNTLDLDRLPVFIHGANWAGAIFEQIFAQATQVVVRTAKVAGNVCHPMPASTIRRVGLNQDEALLPDAPLGFDGYRLLNEYFALPQRFLFFEFTGLREALAKCKCDKIDLVILMREEDPRLGKNKVNAESFALFCAPIINLFQKRLDPILIGDKFSEYHVVADRTHPNDFEIYRIKSVHGQGLMADLQQQFAPFYSARDVDLISEAYYNSHRVPRVLSQREQNLNDEPVYPGSEVYISLVDGHAAPYSSDLAQLNVTALCTNRHLPRTLVKGVGKTDFKLDLFAPVSSIRCMSGPTDPKPAHPDGEIAWRVISHLSLNYLSLITKRDDPKSGPAGLRELLQLYCDDQKAIEGILSATCERKLEPVKESGQFTFGWALEITLEFNELAFREPGFFVLGSVLEQFLARYVSLNSFTKTTITSQQRGKIIEWPAHPGKRQIL